MKSNMNKFTVASDATSKIHSVDVLDTSKSSTKQTRKPNGIIKLRRLG